MELSHKLDRISRNRLHGQPVPPELRLLWQLMVARQLSLDNASLNTVWERLTLLDLTAMDEHPVFFERYSRDAMLERCENQGASPAPFEPRYMAYEDVVGSIAFFAMDHQERFLGYWLGRDRDIPVAEAPLAVLDTNGKFHIAGYSLIELMMTDLLADQPEAAVALRRHAALQLGTEWDELTNRMRKTNLTELASIHGDPQGLFREKVMQRTARLKTISLDD
jgi:hypothetical protein